MDDAHYLSREDKEKFQRLWRDFKQREPNRVRGVEPERTGYQPPEVYVARSPVGGIPATSVEGTGTSSDDVPGSASCQVYRIIESAGTSPDPDEFMVVPDLTRTVFNISGEDVPGGEWVLLVREKWGKWIVLMVDGGGGGGRWRMVSPTSENLDANGCYPGKVQVWSGSAYADAEDCWITLASGEAVIAGETYEGEPVGYLNDDTGTGTSTDPIRIYGICGNTIECAPDECDESGAVVSWARLYHRAPFDIRRGFTSDDCSAGGTGTG